MKKFIRSIDALLAGILIVVITKAGYLDYPDYRISDWLYQNVGERSSDIVVIGIDSATLSKFGPLPTWIRRDIATVIDYMNKEPDSRPAVIGISCRTYRK